MGAKRKYTAKGLAEKVEAYFASITRTVTLKERIETEETDEKGNPVYKTVPICNDSGEQIRQVEYVVPPTVLGLCDYLGISCKTWDSYCEDERYGNTTIRARTRMYAYLQGQTLTRPDKALKGILFNIENNFPDFTKTAAMNRREQELRIAKMEAEIKALEQGAPGMGGVAIYDDV